MTDFEAAWQAIQPIRGWFSNPGQARLMWDTLQGGGHAIEIGSFCGRSAVFLAMACRAAGHNERVYCIDTFDARNSELPNEDTYQEFVRNVATHGVADWIEVVRGDSRHPEIAAGVPRGAALVYLDGGHEYEEVMGDIRTWRGHVRRGGVLLMHDYYSDGQFPGIKRAVRDACAQRLLSDKRLTAPDTVWFRRSTCGCGGW